MPATMALPITPGIARDKISPAIPAQATSIPERASFTSSILRRIKGASHLPTRSAE